MSIAKQARVLDQGAAATSKRILRDHRNGIEPREETLTQNFVSEYVARTRRTKLNAGASEFARRDEARLYGADIALWFTNAAGQFAGVYLQAKVLRSDNTYRGLDHRNQHGRQFDTLIGAARRDGVLAGYAFYNGLRAPDPSKSACEHGIGSPEINGISVASASSMRSHLQRRVMRSSIEEFCSPLSCLVRHATGPGGAGPAGGDGSGSSGGGGRGPADGTDPDLPSALLALSQSWQGSEARLHTSESLPAYVRALAERMDQAAVGDIASPDDAYIDDLDWWRYYGPGPYPGPTEWGDLYPFFTAVLIGPER